MKTYDVPKWMIAPFLAEGVSDSDYFLYGAGRALGFIRMAAYVLDLEVPSSEFKVAEYHTYTGISAARTAIDATASWLNQVLKLGVPQGNQVNLSRPDFQTKIVTHLPKAEKCIQSLGDLGNKINEHRQRAQHREGLAIIHHLDSKKFEHTGGWYLAPNGLSSDRADDIRLPDLLHSWADEIEANLQAIHKTVIASSETPQPALGTEV